MQTQGSPSTVAPLNAPVPGPSEGERRTNKRFLSQQIKLTFLGFEHVAVNWSQGGVLVEDRHPRLALGTDISGVITVRGVEGRFRFSATLVRRDAKSKELAFQFTNPSPSLLEVLNRVNE
jgi:hypothetical protein